MAGVLKLCLRQSQAWAQAARLFLLGCSVAGSLELAMNWRSALPRWKLLGVLLLSWLKHLDSLLLSSSSSHQIAVKACFSAFFLLLHLFYHGLSFSWFLIFSACDFWNVKMMSVKDLSDGGFVFFALT